MNKKEYIDELKKRLNKIPDNESANAIKYYEEYFDEAGEENEQKIIEELGEPSKVASQIIANFAIKDVKESPKKGLSNIWIVILAIFASPIALPIALVIIALVLVFIIVILALIFAIGATAVTLIISGVLFIVCSIVALFQSFATGIFIFGFGMLGLGVGIALLKFVIFMSKKTFVWLTNAISKFLLRRSGK